jgi:hypothetical protein
MSAIPLFALVARCRTLCRPRSQAPDAELLARFARRRDAASEELLERCAPLVWGVCQHITPAETAFLALVRHAGRLEGCRSLVGWSGHCGHLRGRNRTVWWE